jgi:1-acyl-sn-glycerol-3-phosphate acyltransferase
MKFIHWIINAIQILLIFIWTAFCALLGMVLMLVLWDGSKVHYITGYYFYCPVVLAIAGVKVTVSGLENLKPNQPHIFVSNHASHLDVVCIAGVIPIGLFYIAKKELAKVPFLGQYMAFIGHIFVDRKNKDKALASLRVAAEKIKAGKDVITFPEGTRTKTGELMIFKRGSFMIAKDGGIPVMPVAVIGSRAVLPSGGWMLRSGRIHVAIGRSIEVDEFKDLSVEQLADLARTRVLQLLQSK